MNRLNFEVAKIHIDCPDYVFHSSGLSLWIAPLDRIRGDGFIYNYSTYINLDLSRLERIIRFIQR